MTKFDAKIRWRLVGEVDPAWRWSGVLYAYLHPSEPELLYIGKADGATSDLRRRWRADDKLEFWRDLERQRGLFAHRVIVGEVTLPAGRRLSRQLLADVESLLIFAVGPWGNLQSRESRLSRPGFSVRCTGRSWPGPGLVCDGGSV
jgi:hypothetical protein